MPKRRSGDGGETKAKMGMVTENEGKDKVGYEGRRRIGRVGGYFE